MKYASISPVLSILAIASASGASLMTLSNPVADGAINTSGGNNDRSDWGPTIAFPADPAEGAATDFQSITIAHDSDYLYIRQLMFATDAGGFLSGNQMVFFDTDQDRSVGYIGPDGNYAIGADYLLQGTNLFVFTGGANQTGFFWTQIGSASYDDFPFNDHELSFSLGLIGSPVSFDFIATTDFYGGDVYSDTALGGTSGGYYTYTTVPETGATLLGGMAVLCLLGRRRKY